MSRPCPAGLMWNSGGGRRLQFGLPCGAVHHPAACGLTRTRVCLQMLADGEEGPAVDPNDPNYDSGARCCCCCCCCSRRRCRAMIPVRLLESCHTVRPGAWAIDPSTLQLPLQTQLP